MKHTSIRKPLSVLLSILMVLSVFGGMAFPAGAESKTIAEGVIYKLGDTIVLPGDGIYYVKDSERHPAQRIYSNGTVTRFDGDEYSYTLKIDEWGIYAYLDTFGYEEEMSQGLSVLGIKFTGSGTESDPYMPMLAFGEVESTWAGEGEGTEASPWLIKDLNDLRTLSANVADGMTYSGKYLKLAADIDCGSDNWEAIGGKNKFMGTFDGDSHTITYNVATTEDEYEKNKGLFYGVGAGGTVKNLNVAGSISCMSLYSDCLGGIAVYNAGTITNCASSVNITGYGNTIAGIAAWCQDDAKITYCAATGTISWPQTGDYYAQVAGITGINDMSTISNCASLCDIIAPNADADSRAGRLVACDDSGAYSDNYYLSTAQIEGEINSDHATEKTADELKEIGQAAYDAGYTVYGLALGAAETFTVNVKNLKGETVAAPEVTGETTVAELKELLADPAEIPAAEQRIIFAGRELEDGKALSEYNIQRGSTLHLIGKAHTITWNNDDGTLIDTTNVAYGNVPTHDDPVKEADAQYIYTFAGWSPEVTAVTGDAIYTATYTREVNPAAASAAFEAYKAEKKAAVEAMAEEGDSTDAQQIIADAAAAIEALTYDEEKTLDENKAAVDALANIADRLAAQRATDLYAAKIEFDHYKAEQKAAVEAMAQEGDSEAAQQIIAEAAAAIDALIYDEFYTLAENKATVDTLANIADRLAAQRAADAAAAQLAADKAAFDDYKAEQKAAVEAMAEEGDSEAAQQIIAEAAAAIEALTYDEAKTLDENKADVDAAADIADALAAQRAADKLAADKAAFEAYKAEKKAAVEALAEEGDSTDAQQIIADAAAAIEALTYDEAKTLDENKADVDAAEDIADALAAQRAADKAAEDQAAADEVAALIDAIGEVAYTDESKAKIDAAKAAYDALTDAQKALVENYRALTSAEMQYAALEAAAETPDEPEKPADGTCPHCGENHGNDLFGTLTAIVHHLLYFIQSLSRGIFSK